MFFTARSSLCVSEWKEYLSYFWRRREKRDRQLNTHNDASQRPTLSFSHAFSSLAHTHKNISVMLIIGWNYSGHNHSYPGMHAGSPSPQSQLSTHHLSITVVPLVVTYGAPLPCVEDLHRALRPRSASQQPDRERHLW